jgi:hypothetical protein
MRRLTFSMMICAACYSAGAQESVLHPPPTRSVLQPPHIIHDPVSQGERLRAPSFTLDWWVRLRNTDGGPVSTWRPRTEETIPEKGPRHP